MTERNILQGRRLVDIGYVFKQINKISKHSPFDCSFGDMYPTSECRMGLQTKITFFCRMCNMEKSLNLIDDNCEGGMNINNALALSAISTGTGYSTLNEIFSVLNVPFMSSNTYEAHHEQVSDLIDQSVWKVMEKAGHEEAQLSRELGEVDEDDVPLVTVVADGAWSKRSYSVNYNATSGVVSISIVYF